MHPLLCASAQVSTKKLNEFRGDGSPDFEALQTIKTLGFQAYDTLTADLEQHAVAPFFDRSSRLFTPFGMWVDCPGAYQTMMEAEEPSTLATSEVLALIMTSDCHCMFLPEERTAALAEREEEARRYRASAKANSSKLSENARRTRGGRTDRRTKLMTSSSLPPGYRWVPLEALTHKQKLAMTDSLKKAEARRTRKG